MGTGNGRTTGRSHEQKEKANKRLRRVDGGKSKKTGGRSRAGSAKNQALQEELRRSETRYRRVFESAGISIGVYSPSGRLLMCNELAAANMGGRPDDFQGKNLPELYPGAPGERIQRRIDHACAFADNPEYLDQVRLPAGDKWFASNYTAIRDGAGRIAGVQIISRDISERMRIEESLRETAQGLARSQRIGRLGSWDWNVPDNRLHWSDELYGIWGVDRGFALTFDSIAAMIHPDDQAKNLAKVREFQSGMDEGTFEFRILCPGGAVRHILQSIEVTRGADGRATRMFGIMQDITERKQAEERLAASLREKEILLKEIHHRVKNNLQVISGLLTLQAEQLDDERLTHSIQECQSRIWTMAMIHQTLYDSGDLAAIDMADYIRTLAGSLLGSQARRTLPLTPRFDLAPLRLATDRAIPLALIVNELLTNALKHAFPGGRPGEIHVSLRAVTAAPKAEGAARGAPQHELIVADDGVGLPVDFDPAGQKHLGLQLVAMLARQIHGKLACEQDNGARFRITFPSHEANGTPS